MGADAPEVRAAREVTHRAMRRLGWMETMLMAAAGVMALVAGAVTAWLAAVTMGWAFRPVWIVASVTYFVVPALGAIFRGRREDAERRDRIARDTSTEG